MPIADDPVGERDTPRRRGGRRGPRRRRRCLRSTTAISSSSAKRSIRAADGAWHFRPSVQHTLWSQRRITPGSRWRACKKADGGRGRRRGASRTPLPARGRSGPLACSASLGFFYDAELRAPATTSPPTTSSGILLVERLAQRHLPGDRPRSPSRFASSRGSRGRARARRLLPGARDLGPDRDRARDRLASSTRSRSATATTLCTWSSACSGCWRRRLIDGRGAGEGDAKLARGRGSRRRRRRHARAGVGESVAGECRRAARRWLRRRRLTSITTSAVPATPPTAAAAIGRTQLRGSRSD